MGRMSNITAVLIACGEDEIYWTYHELEDLMGRLLPPGAYKYGSMWSNSTQNSHSKHWRAAGYRASRARCVGEDVRFIKVSAPGEYPIPPMPVPFGFRD